MADITAGLLKFTPAANANGATYASFTFQVQDNGGTANGGVDLDPIANTITVNVTAVNDAPAGTNKTVTTLEDTAYTFTAADFGFTDPNDSRPTPCWPSRSRPCRPPARLTNNGVAVTAGQFVSVADITAGLLKFTPAANANGTPTPASPSRSRTTAARPTAASTSTRPPTRSPSTSPPSTTPRWPTTIVPTTALMSVSGSTSAAPGVLANDTDVEAPASDRDVLVTARERRAGRSTRTVRSPTDRNSGFVGVDTFTYKMASDGTASSKTIADGHRSRSQSSVTAASWPTSPTTDADFNHIDGFDVLFGNGTGANKKLLATNPGTFHYDLDLDNETGVTMHIRGKKLPPIYRNGVAIDDNNGASTVVIITVPSLPANVGTTVPTSPSASTVGSPLWAQNTANSAFKADGYKAVRAHPDDSSDDMDLTVSWAASAPGGNCLATSGITWTPGQPPNNAFVKCIKVEGLEIPKKHEAHIHLSLEFGLKGTDNWLSGAQSAFRAGFSFKSQTQVTLDSTFPIPSLADKTYIGNDAAGIVGAGQQYTAIGGFIYDTNGAGIATRTSSSSTRRRRRRRCARRRRRSRSSPRTSPIRMASTSSRTPGSTPRHRLATTSRPASSTTSPSAMSPASRLATGRRAT